MSYRVCLHGKTYGYCVGYLCTHLGKNHIDFSTKLHARLAIQRHMIKFGEGPSHYKIVEV